MRPRIRTIKPEAGLDEKLWDLGESTGLPVFQAFAMLWCCADREGRFEWRPRALKSLCLPYWGGDFADVLEALRGAGFLVKYEADGKVCGLVRTFHDHQKPNAREAASVLPAPPDDDDSGAGNPPVPTGEPSRTCMHVRACGEGKGREGKGREGERAREAHEGPTPQGLELANRVGRSFAGPPPEDPPDDAETVELARRLDLSVHAEWEACRDHALSRASVSADWPAELRSWMRRTAKFQRQDDAKQAARAPPGRRGHDHEKRHGIQLFAKDR